VSSEETKGTPSLDIRSHSCEYQHPLIFAEEVQSNDCSPPERGLAPYKSRDSTSRVHIPSRTPTCIRTSGINMDLPLSDRRINSSLLLSLLADHNKVNETLSQGPVIIILLPPDSSDARGTPAGTHHGYHSSTALVPPHQSTQARGEAGGSTSCPCWVESPPPLNINHQ